MTTTIVCNIGLLAYRAKVYFSASIRYVEVNSTQEAHFQKTCKLHPHHLDRTTEKYFSNIKKLSSSN